MKTGESHHIIKYVLIAVVVVVIQLFGYFAYTTMKDQFCKTDLASFEIDMRDIHKGVGLGEVKKNVFGIPCKVERVYFVDQEKVEENYFANPFLKDSITSNEKDNLYLLREEQMKKKFYTGKLDLRYPGFVCLEPISEQVDFFVEGREKGVAILGGCFQPDCTYFPDDVSEEDAQQIIQDFVDFGFYEPEECPDCPVNTETEMKNYRETLKHIEVLRKFTFCSDTGITSVEVTITPKDATPLKNFKFYESIPKECVDDLRTYLVSAIEGDVTIKTDPLIMWKFGNLAQPETISYQLSKDLDDACRELITGLGVAQFFTGGPPTPTPLAPAPAPPAVPPVVPGVAQLNANYVITNDYFVGVDHHLDVDATIVETNNVGVTMSSVQQCFSATGCNSFQAVSFYVPPAGSIVRPDIRVFSGFTPDTTTITYRGIDDNGNSASVSLTIPIN